MAKRLQLNFHHTGPTMVDENGQPRPCAAGVPWVNQHTLQTLRKRRIPRTDAKGRIIEPTSSATAVGDSSASQD